MTDEQASSLWRWLVNALDDAKPVTSNWRCRALGRQHVLVARRLPRDAASSVVRLIAGHVSSVTATDTEREVRKRIEVARSFSPQHCDESRARAG